MNPRPIFPSLRLLRTLGVGLSMAEGAFVACRLSPATPRAARARSVRQWSSRLLSRLGVKVEVEGALPDPGAGLMFVANHVSWLDVQVLHSLIPARFIAKSEVRRWPVMGWMAGRAGTLFLRRGRARDAARVAETVACVLREGESVAFFPEGTSSDGSEVGRFHPSLFQAAILAGTVVHPVAIRYESASREAITSPSYHGDISFARSLFGVIGEPRIIARVHFTSPIPARGSNRSELTERSHAAIAGILAEYRRPRQKQAS